MSEYGICFMQVLKLQFHDRQIPEVNRRTKDSERRYNSTR